MQKVAQGKEELEACAEAQEIQVLSERTGQRFQIVLMFQMELCTGPTLRCWLHSEDRSDVPLNFTRGKKNQALELAFAKQLMKGIRDMHRVSVVHRDIKPQNVFITQDEVLKIGDLGLSRDEKMGRSRERGTVGTPAYIAPEGGAQATAKADVFSAALIVLELLCPPFATGMERARVFEALRERNNVPDHIDTGLPKHGKLLREMAQVAPEDRPSAKEVYDKLRQWGCDFDSPRVEPASPPLLASACSSSSSEDLGPLEL